MGCSQSHPAVAAPGVKTPMPQSTAISAGRMTTQTGAVADDAVPNANGSSHSSISTTLITPVVIDAATGDEKTSDALYRQVLSTVQSGLGSCVAQVVASATNCLMTPQAALAADSLVGSLRVRDTALGWKRVGADSKLNFPEDHSLHINIADEWYFVVGVVKARGENETSDTSISFCWMQDWRLVQPAPVANPLTAYIVDAQFAVGEERARNDAFHDAIWGGGGSTLVAHSNPLLLSAGSMVLQELPGASDQGLNGFNLSAKNTNSGTALSITLERNSIAAPLVAEAGTGIIGDTANGNGFIYYSAPFLAVKAGGRVVSRNAAGVLTSRTVTGGIAWFDHQLGTIGRPKEILTKLEWDLLVAFDEVSGRSDLPVVDRGFGIAGQENWWGFMFQEGPLKGISFMGTSIFVKPTPLDSAPITGYWFIADGSGGYSVKKVVGTSSTTKLITASNGSEYGAAFSIAIAPPTGADITITGSNLAADGFMQWSKGDVYSEAALILECTDGSRGVGWAEQVGWDRNSTAQLLATLNIPQSIRSVAEWERPPPFFMA